MSAPIRMIVEKGDTLSAIALAVYGRASLWRMLAHVNKLENPHLITPGQTIICPQ
jgi:nucleoid-associated protein YgaU